MRQLNGAMASGAAAQCPNNECSVAGTDPYSGGTTLLQFTADGAGNSGYLSTYDWTQGVNSVNGSFLSNVQYKDYIAQTYAADISGQYGRLSGNLSQFNGVGRASADNPNVIGGHANFKFECDIWGICGPGRYNFGVHVECASGGYNCPGGPLVVHDDTVSPWVSPFSFFNFNPINLIEHGTIDLIGGNLGTNVFSQ